VTCGPERLFCLVFAVSVLASCATPPEQIEPVVRDGALLQRLSCQQLKNEWLVTYRQLQPLENAQLRKTGRDVQVGTVELVPTWPAVLLNGNDPHQVDAIASYRGKLLAIDDLEKRKCRKQS
jgi:hypothetical protein